MLEIAEDVRVEEEEIWLCAKCWREITEAEAANYDGMCRGCFEDAA